MTYIISILLALLVVSLFILVKLKNFYVFVISFLPYLLYTIYNNYQLCQASPMSEDCVWAYLRYVPTPFIGMFIFIIASTFQYLYRLRKQT